MMPTPKPKEPPAAQPPPDSHVVPKSKAMRRADTANGENPDADADPPE